MALEAAKAGPLLPSGDGVGPSGVPAGSAVQPLNVTGLVVTKADLVRALRLYVPQLVDIAPLDHERFLLGFTPIPRTEG